MKLRQINMPEKLRLALESQYGVTGDTVVKWCGIDTGSFYVPADSFLYEHLVEMSRFTSVTGYLTQSIWCGYHEETDTLYIANSNSKETEYEIMKGGG